MTGHQTGVGFSWGRRQGLALAGACCLGRALPLQAAEPATDRRWTEIEQAARGQTVHFHAWAGSAQVNAYIAWAAQQIQRQHGVRLEHVRIRDVADVVRRVQADRQTGRQRGAVDLVWINGENFAAMKQAGLLFGPFAEQLPHFRWVDTAGKPTTVQDFSVPVEGMEAPWGMAQLTFFADAQRLPVPPTGPAEWLDLARRQPGRLSYPRPPDFHGTTWLKQILIALAPEPALLQQAVQPAVFERQTAPLWDWLTQLHPHLWRQGRQFPLSAAAMRQMMADGELLIALSFNPNEAANEMAAGRLADTVYSWQFRAGSVGNTHFLAIPWNAQATAGAQVVANWLLSPMAQARKADIAIWGDPTVLDLPRLPPDERRHFVDRPMPGQLRSSVPVWPEPHASWVQPLEQAWGRRFLA